MINNRNLSFLFGVLFIVSLFLTWIFDYSLIEISRVANYDITKWTLPKYMFVYMGFVFLVLGVISLLMNFGNKIWMSKIVLYLVPLYFIIVCILNISDSTGATGATGATTCSTWCQVLQVVAQSATGATGTFPDCTSCCT